MQTSTVTNHERMSYSEQIAGQLRDEIAAGQLRLGDKLPTERELSKQFGVAPGTVRVALRNLVEEGYLDGGRGTRKLVIGRPGAPDPFERFRSFALWARQQGHAVGGSVQRMGWEDAVARDVDELGVEEGSPVLAVLRLRTLDHKPVLLERTRYVETVGRLVERLDKDCPSVTAALAEQFEVEFSRAQHLFGAVGANEDDARLLALKTGSPLLAHLRVSYDRAGRPLEHSEDRYLPGVVAVAVGNSRAVNPLRWTYQPEQFPG